MRVITEKVEHDLSLVDEAVEMRGMIAGDLTVSGTSDVAIIGMVCGNLRIVSGHVRLDGMVNGDVTNVGGALEVYGSIHGRLWPMGGQTTVDPKADIRP